MTDLNPNHFIRVNNSTFVHQWDALSIFILRLRSKYKGRSIFPNRYMGSPGSRERCFRTCSRSLTAQGPNVSRGYIRYCLPYRSTTLAPWSIGISRLNTRPIRSPVNASAMSLLPQPHDSGSVWFATPSLYESFTHYTFAVLTGALGTSPEPPYQMIIFR